MEIVLLKQAAVDAGSRCFPGQQCDSDLARKQENGMIAVKHGDKAKKRGVMAKAGSYKSRCQPGGWCGGKKRSEIEGKNNLKKRERAVKAEDRPDCGMFGTWCKKKRDFHPGMLLADME